MSTRRRLLDEAEQIARTAITENRDLRPDETSRIEDLIAQVKQIDHPAVTPSVTFDELARRLGGPGDGTPQVFLAPARTTAEAVTTAMTKAAQHSPTFGTKALLVAGDLYAEVPTLTADPFAMPRPPTSLLDALPVSIIRAPTFSWLRQGTRTNNAAVVPTFSTKPESVYGLTQQDGKLRVFAHVSEPFDEYWVADAPGLTRFLESEMTYGLRAAVEDSVLNGAGGNDMTGIAATSGIQTQSFDTSMFTSTRKGVTKAEALGFSPRFWVMNATDWEAIELSAFTSGNYILNSEGSGNLPVDAAARRLWGVPVVLSTVQTAGGCYLVSDGTVELVTDGRLLVQTSNATASDFTANQLRMRVEQRFELAVTSPPGIVSVDLAA